MDTCKDQTSQGYCEYIIEVLDVLNKHKALDRDVTNKILSPAERVDSLGRHRDFLLQRLDSLRSEVERLTRERDEAIRQIGPLAAENERLRGALEALGVMPDGYCFCSTGRDPDKARHEPECRDARAALAGQWEGE